mgnify:CR=1 FL=1
MKTIYSDEYINIITNLRNARLKKQITQNELATKLGVNQSFVSKVENRERRLDVVEFICWIDALKISIQDVFPQKFF